MIKSRTSGTASSSLTEMVLLVHDSIKHTSKSDFVQELSDHPDDNPGRYWDDSWRRNTSNKGLPEYIWVVFVVLHFHHNCCLPLGFPQNDRPWSWRHPSVLGHCVKIDAEMYILVMMRKFLVIFVFITKLINNLADFWSSHCPAFQQGTYMLYVRPIMLIPLTRLDVKYACTSTCSLCKWSLQVHEVIIGVLSPHPSFVVWMFPLGLKLFNSIYLQTVSNFQCR